MVLRMRFASGPKLPDCRKTGQQSKQRQLCSLSLSPSISTHIHTYACVYMYVRIGRKDRK